MTGEPYAGEPHVRFGGRGDANQCIIPTPILIRNSGLSALRKIKNKKENKTSQLTLNLLAAALSVIDMNESGNNISDNLIDFIDHCSGCAVNYRRGFWLLDEINKPKSPNIKKAVVKCLRTLRKINKEELNKDSEFILIDRVYELNYRVLGRYLNRKITKDVLEDLQKINYFVQGIICKDVKNLDKHYELNKNP